MPVVTIISDLGNRDYHIPAVKGVLLSANSQANIVDISHQVRPYHFIEAAFILGNCFRDFPPGTLHLIGVEGDFNKSTPWIIAKLEGHYFFTKNTGLLALISDQTPDWVNSIEIEHKRELKFPLKSILAKAAAQVLKGAEPKNIGQPIESFVQKGLMQAAIGQKSIHGTVVFITPYSNAITNIHRRDFDTFKTFATCRIYYNKMDHFQRISNSYHDVPEGMACCFFGANGFLEIGIHGGNAKNLLSIIEGKKIFIEFE